MSDDLPYLCERCFLELGYEFPRNDRGAILPVGNCVAKCSQCKLLGHYYLREDLSYKFDEMLKKNTRRQ